jgi:hypothetical protein
MSAGMKDVAECAQHLMEAADAGCDALAHGEWTEQDYVTYIDAAEKLLSTLIEAEREGPRFLAAILRMVADQLEKY